MNNSEPMSQQGHEEPAWNLVGARRQQQHAQVALLDSRPLMAMQEQPLAAAVGDNGNGEEVGRKKKKKLSKSERLAKREEKALKQIYGPKDAHINLISAADLRKFQHGSSSTSTRAPKKAEFVSDDFPSIGGLSSASRASGITFSSVSARSVAHSSLDDFPSLCNTTAVVVDEQPPPESTVEEPNLESAEAEEIPVLAVSQIPPEVEAPKPPVEAASSGKKKSKKPIVITLDALLNQAKESEKTKEKLPSKLVASSKTAPKKTVGNLLDSTGPVVISRGKIRETPKNKKPTKLKKVILTSRASRQNNGNQELVKQTLDEDPAEETSERSSARDGLGQGLPDADSGQLQILAETEELDKLDVSNIVATAVASSVHNEVLIQLLNLALSEQTHVQAPDQVEPKAIEPIIHSEELLKRIKSTMHSRKFRPYCDMYLSKELHGHVIALLKELHRFQDRLYHTDPLKYQMKRRYVHGIKKVISYLQINKVVLVIMAPDIEPSAEAGGLDDQISAILSMAKERNVPVVFSGNRYILGKPIYIKTPVSSIAILNRSGADEIFKTLVEQAEAQRSSYQEEFLQRVRSEAGRTSS